MTITTHNWSLIVRRVSTSTIEIWLGNFRQEKIPDDIIYCDVFHEGNLISSYLVSNWARPFSRVKRGVYSVLQLGSLLPRQTYQLICRTNTGNQQLGKATAITLPESLPKKNEKPFTIALGSCFSNQDDHGQLGQSYNALFEHGGDHSPEITFLVGDQVYLDIGLDSLIPFPCWISSRIAKDYEQSWQGLEKVFSAGATWMLPDDHEYWNDYPFNDLPIFALQALKLPFVRRAWQESAIDGVRNVQGSKLLEIISIGNDLSICLADLRSGRSKDHFLPPEEFLKLTDWARNLNCPGVLVIPQILIDYFADGERNLLCYPQQYQLLIEALAASGNDILVMSGDVHYGRIAQVALGNSGAQLTEVVSSPLSNLRGLLNGWASSAPETHLKTFPDAAIISHFSLGHQAVKYDLQYQVSTLLGKRFSPHPKTRTQEHFMSINFTSEAGVGVCIEVNAWKVRSTFGVDSIPQQDFPAPFKTILRTKRKNVI